MVEKNDFLVEIGTEELPPKELSRLMNAFKDSIAAKLHEAGLHYQGVKAYAAPRRLAVQVLQLDSTQPNRPVERKGPALNAAFDAHGKPTKACEGFARSCGVAIEQLTRQETPQGTWMVYHYEERGKPVNEIMADIIQTALTQLPVAKTMRWGVHPAAFIRPIHWIALLYGSQTIDAEILATKTSNTTRGHRFHCPQALEIKHPDQYETILENQGKVIADFTRRQALIVAGINKLAAAKNAIAIVEPSLLDEVTALVEWPVPLLASFEPRFLEVPKEALISAMQGHQKCFPLTDAAGKLMPYFITVSNIESKQPSQVIIGNERVMRARLSDAAFFYHTDLKTRLVDRCAGLKNVLFQAKLGNLLEKSQRISTLAELILSMNYSAKSEEFFDAKALIELPRRAGMLCKADLMSAMVGEFPELQGIMGAYYARHDGENEKVATAIREHYLPRTAQDELPSTLMGCAVALADRLDTLVGLFSINQPPTGDKDPFGLRRAALGIIRITITRKLNLPMPSIFKSICEFYGQTIENSQVAEQVHQFILDRLRPWYQDKGITPDVVAAVLARETSSLLGIDYRIRAVHDFRLLEEAKDLIAANKRVKNLLEQANFNYECNESRFNEIANYLVEDAEKKLFNSVQLMKEKIGVETSGNEDDDYYSHYKAILFELAKLREPINYFFDTVMVNSEVEQLKKNRLMLLAEIRTLFFRVADISLLQI